MNEMLYNDQTSMERAIISCLLTKPELTEQLTIKPQQFAKHRGLLLFLQNFYKQFGNYDLTLMSVVAVNKAQFVDEVTDIITNILPITANFVAYQEQLIKLQEFEQQEKRNINAIIDLTVQLKARIISVEEFRKEVGKI